MTWYIIAGVFAALFLYWMHTKAKLYNSLFADEHFVEFGRGVVKAVAASIDLLDRDTGDSPSPDDPRNILTDAGMLFYYTIAEEGGVFEHHYSISIAGRYTPHAVGGTFAVFAAHLLGVSPEQLSLGISQHNVYHTVFRLTEEEQRVFLSREIQVPDLGSIDEIRAECMKVRDQLTFERFSVDLPKNP